MDETTHRKFYSLDPDADEIAAPCEPVEASELIAIQDAEGQVLFVLEKDGTVYLPHPERVEEAAGIFWSAVEATATLQGFEVHRTL